MDRLKPWALVGLIFGPLLLVSHVKTSFAPERPFHAAAIIFVVVGSFLVLSARIFHRYLDDHSQDRLYTSVPLDDVDDSPHSSRPTSPVLQDIIPNPPPSLRQLRIAFVILTIALCIRAELIRRILKNIQCAGRGYTVLLPFLFAALDYWTVQRHKTARFAPDEIDDSIYDMAQQYWAKSHFRYLLPTAMFSLTSAAILYSEPTLGSTYVCPETTLARRDVALSTFFALPIDFCIVFCVNRIFQHDYSLSRKASPTRSLSAVGYACLLASFTILIIGVFYYFLSPDDRFWTLSMPPAFVSSLVKLTVISCITTLSICLCLHFYAVIIPTAIIVFTLTTAATISSSWRNRQPFPPSSPSFAFFFYLLNTIAFAVIIVTQATSERHSHTSRTLFKHIPAWLFGLLFVLFVARIASWIAHASNANFHPGDMLIFEAKERHERYTAYASSSTNLSSAIRVYEDRYGRQPPPGFDEWYEYATTRNAAVIDDFDRIYTDTLPFWAVSPMELRQRTWQAISNPWNDVAGISIRNGKAEISPNVMPTHRWMLDGITEMINHFGQFIPDMDLGFNLNDESRVSVPYDTIQNLRKIGGQRDKLAKTTRNGFSKGRAETWPVIPAEPIGQRSFREMSWQQTFYEYGNSACPPGSAARNNKYWDTGNLCTSCAAPHSLGAFLANWTLAADVCHQPDMANLHGFYLSPAAYKTTHDLFPVFSQSKAPGFNDILYPSAWNYMDKAKYAPNDEHPDMPFEKKQRTLFWRGATSEGVSPGSGTWKGMSRQRFVHLTNNINNTTPTQPILLPHGLGSPRRKLAYTSVSLAELTKYMSVDVRIVDNIARCGGRDCTEQSAEFAPLAPPTDFQAHWSYKYLLDLDGAGFSGRFLPFLSSRSLPLKAALFREWYDSRLTPWLHFVPLDLRGHGFWATLVYFAGFEGKVNGRVVSVPAHDREAEIIAEGGREWAGRVLRKEDMEVYFFRLLLEWGRLTDDGRDELGFTLA